MDCDDDVKLILDLVSQMATNAKHGIQKFAIAEEGNRVLCPNAENPSLQHSKQCKTAHMLPSIFN